MIVDMSSLPSTEKALHIDSKTTTLTKKTSIQSKRAKIVDISSNNNNINTVTNEVVPASTVEGIIKDCQKTKSQVIQVTPCLNAYSTIHNNIC